MGSIYKVTNIINQKVYIGQTTKTIKNRWKHHLSQLYDDTYFHRAILKYGVENFIIESIEDNIPDDLLNEKESYYITKYNSYKSQFGYNCTRGGEYHFIDINKKISDESYIDILDDLKFSKLSQQEIADKYNISFSTVSDINTGRNRRENLIGVIKYPIRKPQYNYVDETTFNIIVEMLSLKMFSYKEISNYTDISISIISRINTGIFKKFSYPLNTTFPIIDGKIVSDVKVSKKTKILILIDILKNVPSKQIMEKYKISLAYIKSLKNNQNNNYMFNDIKFPLLENKEYNLEKLDLKLQILEKYNMV